MLLAKMLNFAMILLVSGEENDQNQQKTRDSREVI